MARARLFIENLHQKEEDTGRWKPYSRGTKASAGLDLHVWLGLDETLTIEPGETVLLPTGIRIQMLNGTHGEIKGRSGLALQRIRTHEGLIDVDYAEELQVILSNDGAEPYTVEHGDRVAQLLLKETVITTCQFSNRLATTKPSRGGFGSSGR